jgi:hypothetical protein
MNNCTTCSPVIGGKLNGFRCGVLAQCLFPHESHRIMFNGIFITLSVVFGLSAIFQLVYIWKNRNAFGKVERQGNNSQILKISVQMILVMTTGMAMFSAPLQRIKK